MNRLHPLVLSAATLLSTAPLLAQSLPQDLLAVTFSGNAVTLDSRTGFGQVIGQTGFTGHNCMARNGATLYTTEQVGSGATAQRFLDTIDDATGQATRLHALTRDLRGLAPRNATTLFAIADNGSNDDLVRVSTLSGAIVVIGAIGFGSVQGLTQHGGLLYGWDLNAGLIRIDATTGVGTDVNPNVGTNGAGIQFLTTMRDGRVLGGQHSLFEIDVVTGVPDLKGSGQYNDLRGAEERFGAIYTFGQGCGATLTLVGTPVSPALISTSSTGHLPSTVGLLFIGFNDRNYQGVPLPLNLDNFLGTVGCFAYAGPDVSSSAVASPQGILALPILVPAGAPGFVFHVQHMSLSNAPGGLTFSNGGSVRLQL